jgi:hypothetical protein
MSKQFQSEYSDYQKGDAVRNEDVPENAQDLGLKKKSLGISENRPRQRSEIIRESYPTFNQRRSVNIWLFL